MLVAGREVAVTNAEKIFFPKPGITKGDLVQYYVDVAGAVLHHVARRPMQMKRHPNGVEGDFFYQKRVPNPHPEWLEFPLVREIARGIAKAIVKLVPAIATTQWKVAGRPGVFVDYGQNAFDRTIASAYSVRPVEDARVSAPLRWDEVSDVEPGDFTLRTMRDRLARVGDVTAGGWGGAGGLGPPVGTLKGKRAPPQPRPPE